MACGDVADLVVGGGVQGDVGEPVDASGQSVAGQREGLEGVGLEDRDVGAGDAQAVRDVVFDLRAFEGVDMASHDNALVEGFVYPHGEALAQFAGADEQQAQARITVHAEVGEQAQLLESLVGEVVGLVEDQQRGLSRLLDEARDLAADGPPVGDAMGGVGLAEGLCEDTIDIEDAAGRQVDIADLVETLVEAVTDHAAHSGLSAAGCAGEQADAAQLEQVADPRFGLLGAVMLEHLIAVQAVVERPGGEGKVFAVHRPHSVSSVRKVSVALRRMRAFACSSTRTASPAGLPS